MKDRYDTIHLNGAQIMEDSPMSLPLVFKNLIGLNFRNNQNESHGLPGVASYEEYLTDVLPMMGLSAHQFTGRLELACKGQRMSVIIPVLDEDWDSVRAQWNQFNERIRKPSRQEGFGLSG